MAKRTRAKPSKPKKGIKKDPAAVSTESIEAPGSPKNYRLRVRMYRHGLGDCFLLTFPRTGSRPFQMLIDCGALARDAKAMTKVVEHIRDTVRKGYAGAKAKLDIVVGTHEHKDHLSGFNQAREVFDEDFDFGAVWLAWTENLTQPQIRRIKETRKKVAAKLEMAVAKLSGVDAERIAGISSLLAFSSDDDDTPTGKVAHAIEYLKVRGKAAGNLQYLEPGANLEFGVPGVRVYVLGPPRDPIALKTSDITGAMKREGVIYSLARMGDTGIDSLAAAVEGATAVDGDKFHPFATDHRIAKTVPDPVNPRRTLPNPYYGAIEDFVSEMYEAPSEAWRRIDHDWLRAMGQLALDLDNDTNNSSLVLAFEFEDTRDVLLFPADAQVGNWQSWAKLEFKSAQRPAVHARDLLNRTAFYKVGHHCSHNATLKAEGLELMTRDDLVAFIPLDRETAKKQGAKGWEMPAPALFKALKEKTGGRVVVSDVKDNVPEEAEHASVVATGIYIDYFLK